MNTSITPHRLAALHQTTESLDLIDVRTPAEFREGHISFARNVPLDRLDLRAISAERNGRANEPLYVICRTGSRGELACQKLEEAGLNAVNIEGGMLVWDAAGFPVVRGKATISLERQVRIAIGLVVLSSSVLALLHHPFWIGLAAFMGAGLIFSGITDFCGLALVLGRMPWNQVGTKPCTTTADQEAMCCSVRRT
jgi:Rhodanese-related sulfurtransferase